MRARQTKQSSWFKLCRIVRANFFQAADYEPQRARLRRRSWTLHMKQSLQAAFYRFLPSSIDLKEIVGRRRRRRQRRRLLLSVASTRTTVSKSPEGKRLTGKTSVLVTMSGTAPRAKKRVRDGWVSVKDYPHLQVTSDDESVSQDRLKPESEMSFPKGRRNKNQLSSDQRQDGNSSRGRDTAQSRKRLDMTTGSSRGHMNMDHGDEIGFEVEMDNVALSGSNDIDQASSRSSSLVFSISKVSFSEKSGEVIEKDHLWESSRNDKTKTTRSKPRASGVVPSLSSIRKTPVFIDVDMADINSTNTIRDETPKAHNRSSNPKSTSRKKRRSLIPKITTAPRTPANTQRSSGDSTGGSHPSLEDSPDKASSQRTHPSLEDSLGGGCSTPRSHPSLEDTPMRRTSTPPPPLSLSDILATDGLSPRTHPSLEDRKSYHERHSGEEQKTQKDDILDSPSSDSSEDVDGRWERLREKLLAVESSSPTSAEVDGYWDRQQERVAKAFSPRSLSDDMKDDLIQDCIDTGLPSPPKERKTKMPGPVVRPGSKVSLPGTKKMETNVISSPGIRRAPSSEFPSKLPTSASKKAKRKQATSQNRPTPIEEKDGTSLDFQNKCLQETTAETVHSGLTGEFDEGSGTGCSISDIEVEGVTDMDILKNLSSVSHNEEMKTPAGLDQAISSASEESSHPSYGDERKSDPTHSGSRKEISDVPKAIVPPKKLRNKNRGKEESTKMPRIEVTLISHTSGDESRPNGTMKAGLKQDIGGERGGGLLKSPVASPIASLFTDGTESNATASNIDDSTMQSGVVAVERRPLEPTPTQPCAAKQIAGSNGEPESKETPIQRVRQAEKQISNFRTAQKKGKEGSSAPANELPAILSNKCNNGERKEGNAEARRTSNNTAPGCNLETKLKPDSPDLSLETTKIIITGRQKVMDAARTGRQDKDSPDMEGEATLIDVASTLTQETGSTHLRTPVPSVATSTPVLRKSSKINNNDDKSSSSADLSVGFKNAKSFDTKLSATTQGIPSWRLDPSQSLTDFTIQILNQGNGDITTYHIHKHVVAVGPRRSEYLDTLFRASALPSTQMTMEEKPANLVPTLLDYMYCHDVEIEVSTATVLAYRKVALTFKVIPLLVKAAGFILQDVRRETMCTYVEEASRYKDKQILKLIVARCAAKIDKFDFADPMWSVMAPDTFLQILSSPAIDREKLSAYLSILVTEYQTLHKYEIDSSKFGQLTAEEILPIIDRSAALPLLEICDEYGCPEEFGALQKRCAHVMACYWKITSEGDRKRVFALLRSLPSNFTVDFLETIEIGKSATLVNALKTSRSLAQSKTCDSSATAVSLGSLCNDLAGEDGYSISSSDNAPLCWRTDPKLTYSDWKIKVKHHGTDLSDAYNVHKHVLSVGSHRSNFFADAFFSEGHTQARRGVTTIELAPAAAVLVPKMLDFIYTQDHRLEVSNDNAVAMRFLARVFGVWMLNKKLVEFIVRDIAIDNVLTYIDQAETFDDEKVVSIAVRLCVGKIQTITVDSPLLKELKPDFFGRIVSSSELDKSSSCHVSIIIAKYFTLHDLSEALLGQLLEVSKMTEIDSTSALQLLRIIDSLKSKEMEVFKNIRKRCVHVITENWNDLRDSHREEMFEMFRRLEPNLIVDIFDWVESFYNEQQNQTMTLQVKLVKRYRKQLADARALRDEDIAKLQNEKDEKIAELTATKEELERQLRHFNDASARRAVRSSGAYRAQTPSKRTGGVPSPRKSLIPSPLQKPKPTSTAPATPQRGPVSAKPVSKPRPVATATRTPEPAASPKQSGKIQSVLSQNLAEARESTMQNTERPTQASGSIFGFSLFTCAIPSPSPAAPQYPTHAVSTDNGIPSYENSHARHPI